MMNGVEASKTMMKDFLALIFLFAASQAQRTSQETQWFGRFTRWLRDNDGYLHPAVVLRPEETRGLGAQDAIGKEELLLAVPRKLMVTPDTFMAHEDGSTRPCVLSCDEASRRVSAYVAQQSYNALPQNRLFLSMAAYLTHQLDHTDSNGASAWLEDLNKLPSPSLPFTSGNAFAVRLLWPSPSYHVAERRRQWLSRDHRKILSNIDRGVLGEGFTLEQYGKAVSLISSRAFSIPVQPREGETWRNRHKEEDAVAEEDALVPFLELFNHRASEHVNLLWNYDSATDFLEVRSTRRIAPGEELINSYGRLSNRELLEGFGFTLPPCEEPRQTYALQPWLITAAARQVANGSDVYSRVFQLLNAYNVTDMLNLGQVALDSDAVSPETSRLLGLTEKRFGERVGEFWLALLRLLETPYRDDPSLEPFRSTMHTNRKHDPSSYVWWTERTEGNSCDHDRSLFSDDEGATNAARVKMSEYVCLRRWVDALEGLLRGEAADGAGPSRPSLRDELLRWFGRVAENRRKDGERQKVLTG
ncbi:unnamed protein product [Vitrella brassicaformis CCMP3155]|uniref:SET domain-containing protein n=1 Tax=Vitrella brassicaformis (strain CCMP3155) TaxID=1169540 RepID=A0A0G4H0R5_VITBC|nr:unnamed protein product [Vitrella brassicaformis CCMP3155]|eukprot:CEM37163.1 unnamed protein product [Vitrella brassicaformis CCMP3155]